MTPTDYLTHRLQHCTDHDLSEQEKAVLDKHGVEEFIFKQLTSKKFRKWSVPEPALEKIRHAIHFNVERNLPIHLTFPFGGYKLWRLPTSPEVDWAEFFMVSYYASYMAPIATAYAPGILLSFSSDDIIIERMNNVPSSSSDTYCDSFNRLLDSFHAHFPTNLRIELVRVRDMYPDKEEYERELAENVKQFKEQYDALEPSVRDRKEKTSALNIRWDGVRDLTGLSEAERKQMIAFGPILHDATCAVSKRRAFVRGEDKIVIFTNPNKESIPLGSSKTSRTKFWTGFGVLEKHGEEFHDRILSPAQYEHAATEDHDIVPVDLIPLKNFSEIMVFDQPFKFGSAV